MKTFDIVLAVAAFLSGLTAASHWLKVSNMAVVPTWTVEPGDQDASQAGWIAGILQNLHSSSSANATAAKWTAVSVFLISRKIKNSDGEA